MNKGTRIIICAIAIILMIIAEKGIPVNKLSKWDYFLYTSTFFVFILISDCVY